VPGLRISEHLPKLAKHTKRMALVRSMSTREGDHVRGTTYLHTGYLEGGPVRYPTLGSLVAKERDNDASALPPFVSIGTPRFPTRGFRGAEYAPRALGDDQRTGRVDVEKSLRVPALVPEGDVVPKQAAARLGLLEDMRKEFNVRHASPAAANRRSAYDRAVR